jgi:transketolase
MTELTRVCAGDLPADWDQGIQTLLGQSADEVGALETRKASAKAIGALSSHLPELVGGSADLAESNGTDIADGGDVQFAGFQNRNLRFGIREHGMGAILNGMLAHGGFRVFGATFLVFSDYMRPSIRLAALMELPAIYVFTHDSVYLGEDGPTHQPVEHMAALRAIPGLVTIRPADAFETWDAWRVALAQKDRPVALALTRQKVPSANYGSEGYAARADVGRGAYVLLDCEDEPEVILIGTGSEVELCIASAQELTQQHGLAVRVVSMPSWELFADQDASYRDQVLPASVKARVAVEAGTTFGWERYTGDAGVAIGIDRFGLSAPGNEAAAALGLTVENVVAAALTSRDNAGILTGERA